MIDRDHYPPEFDTEQRRLLLAALVHPDCPWEPAGCDGPGRRRVQADRLFAHAFSNGASLEGIEPRCDQLIASIGGRRLMAAPQAPGRDPLPVYVLPLPVAEWSGPLERSVGHHEATG